MIDKNMNSICKVNVLSAMRMIQNLWKNKQQDVISDCWRHTGMQGRAMREFLS